MRLPIPQHSLVALTLIGALLTTVVAIGLTAPGVFGVAQTGPADSNTGSDALASDAPQPNESFTPAVQTQPSGEHEEWEEHEEEESEDDDDDQGGDDHDDDQEEHEDDD